MKKKKTEEPGRCFDEIFDKYLIYGENLNSKEKIINEGESFIEYMFHDKTGKNSYDLLLDFAKYRKWPTNTWNNPAATDLKALWNYYQIQFFGPPFKREWKKSWIGTREDEREQIRLNYEKFRKEEKLITHEQFQKIVYWERKREAALDKLSQITNENDLIKWEQNDFIPTHKGYLKAWGLIPCKAVDCTRYIKPPKRKYCSAACSRKYRSRKYRKNHPKSYLKSQKKYLDFLSDEGDLD